jgi:hypothetical protein
MLSVDALQNSLLGGDVFATTDLMLASRLLIASTRNRSPSHGSEAALARSTSAQSISGQPGRECPRTAVRARLHQPIASLDCVTGKRGVASDAVPSDPQSLRRPWAVESTIGVREQIVDFRLNSRPGLHDPSARSIAWAASSISAMAQSVGCVGREDASGGRVAVDDHRVELRPVRRDPGPPPHVAADEARGSRFTLTLPEHRAAVALQAGPAPMAGS